VSGRVRIPTSSQVGVTSEADPGVDAGAPAAPRWTAAIDERDHERSRTPTDTTTVQVRNGTVPEIPGRPKKVPLTNSENDDTDKISNKG
jgi:hypothetical protein